MPSLENLKREAELRKEKLRRDSRKLFWALYHHRNTRGRRMSFRDARFLVPIYKALDAHREVVLEKSVQCGISEAFVISHLEEAARGLAVIYALPTGDLRNGFVQHRVNKPIKDIPLYARILKDTPVARADSVRQKNFGRGVIRYAASDVVESWKEFPADAVYLDEKDEMDQDVIRMAPDRLKSSEHRLFRAVSNPTVENYGIDVDWRESSKGLWHVRCGCGAWQPLEWYRNVVRRVGDGEWEFLDREWDPEDPASELRPVCGECGRPLDRFMAGEYVHERPGARKRGFRVDQTFGAPKVPLREVGEWFLKSRGSAHAEQLFDNSACGMPHSSSENRVDRAALRGCEVPGARRARPRAEGEEPLRNAVAGIDVGKRWNMVVRQAFRAGEGLRAPLVWCGVVDGPEGARAELRRWGVKRAVVDALPEARLVKEAQKQEKGLWRCYFSDSAKYPIVNRDERALTLDRTEAIDAVLALVRARGYENPPWLMDVPDYADQMGANTRVFVEKRGRFAWLQTGPDHYLLAEAYCVQAALMTVKVDFLDFYKDASGEAQDEIERLAAQEPSFGQKVAAATEGMRPDQALAAIARLNGSEAAPPGILGGF